MTLDTKPLTFVLRWSLFICQTILESYWWSSWPSLTYKGCGKKHS